MEIFNFNKSSKIENLLCTWVYKHVSVEGTLRAEYFSADGAGVGLSCGTLGVVWSDVYC